VVRFGRRGRTGSKETNVKSFYRRLLALCAASALLLAACGGNGADSSSGEQTIDWWHIQSDQPMRGVWAKLAKEFEASHPGVKIKITPLQNEPFKAKVTTAGQSGNPPDLFQSWGGGVMKQQIDAGLVQDITNDVQDLSGNISPGALSPYQLDGRTYGIPFTSGMVGFWYNKALFDKAGITEPPATWAEFLDVVEKLKAAGITPIGLGEKEKWPGHFYWTYLAMRQVGKAGLDAAIKDGSFDSPGFVQAGDNLKALVDLEPFQKGFLGAAYAEGPESEAALMGNAKVAMELMGQWGPGTQTGASGRTEEEGIGDDLGFFPFPAVDGGSGAPTEVLGGGDGFVVGKDAPPETLEFLKFLFDETNYRNVVKQGQFIPTLAGTEDTLVDKRLEPLLDTLSQSTEFQLYLDQAYPPAVGETINDSTAALFAGEMSPEDVAQAVATTAKNEVR
jgi:raffinose/stachyose/melibiose transport system substrate-binding protein